MTIFRLKNPRWPLIMSNDILITYKVQIIPSKLFLVHHTRQTLCLTIKSKFPVNVKFTLTFKLNVSYISHLLGFSLPHIILTRSSPHIINSVQHCFISRKSHILFICDYYCFIIVVVVGLFSIILPQTVDHHRTQLFSQLLWIRKLN